MAGGSARGRAPCVAVLLRAGALPYAPLCTQRACRAVRGGQFGLGHAGEKDRPWQRQRRHHRLQQRHHRLQQPREHGRQVVAAVELVLELRQVARRVVRLEVRRAIWHG